MFFDKCVNASTNSDKRYISPLDCECYISHREIWSKAPKAAARKATMPGVNWIAVDESDGFYIYQVSGYTQESGMFCYNLDKEGRIIA